MERFRDSDRLAPRLAQGRWTRRAWWQGGLGLCLLPLAACSKDPVEVAAAPQAPAAGDTARAAFERSKAGRGFVVGDAASSRELRVFFDPQCPHCARLWLSSKPLLDRVRAVWMPVAFIAERSAAQGAALLAAADPLAAMDAHEAALAQGQGGLPANEPADPQLLAQVQANTALWQALNADAVPYLLYRVTPDGPYGRQSGGMPTAQLAELLEV